MTNKTFKSLLAVSAASLAIVGSAQAGGFTRGKADTQIIYEEGNFNMRSGVTVVAPTRKYTDNPNPAAIGVDYADTYVVPSSAVKLNVTDDLRCAATLVNSVGGSSSTPVPNDSVGTRSEKFTSYEYGATCGYKFDLSKGRLWVIGGVFAEDFDYDRTIVNGTQSLTLDGLSYGYRAGLAYEIPEIALRTELMYRSAAGNNATGVLTVIPAADQTVYAHVENPQSVELNVQSGVAPGWLAFGSIRWTEWSSLQTLDVRANALGGAIVSQGTYYWRDAWTVTGGVGHAFTENLSGVLAVTYDRGTGTGFDLTADVWTVSAGASLKDKWGGELRGGVGVSRLGSATDYNGTAATADDSAVGTDWSVAGSIGYAVKW